LSYSRSRGIRIRVGGRRRESTRVELSLPGTGDRVGGATDVEPTPPVLVSIESVRDLGTIFCAFGDVTWATQELALGHFSQQLAPCASQVSTDGEALGSRVNVIELEP
jgi:hypothetical protein